MKRKQYDAEIDRCCKYCERASSLSAPDRMLCGKHGVVEAGGCCRRFVYDPLKREPAPPAKLQPMEFVEL